jgi:thioredoxin reductase (NADPH)
MKPETPGFCISPGNNGKSIMYDLLIIGAGPAGISMAVEACAAGVPHDKILLLEKAPEHSYTIKKYYPDNKRVTANYKGFEAVCTGVMCLTDSSKHETISYLDETIQNHKFTVRYGETVHRLSRDNGSQTISVETQRSAFESRVVVVAIGILGKPNKPEYPLPARLKSRLLFDVTSTSIKDSRVLVVGGGDSASEYCQYLAQSGNRVSLSYRRKDFERMNRINRASLEAMAAQGSVEVLTGSNIKEVKEHEGLPRIAFSEPEFGERDFDYVLYALGGTTPRNFLKTIGIAFDGDEPILLDGHQTSVPGLFLIGDLSAGNKGGSIIWAFNSANRAMETIRSEFLPAVNSLSIVAEKVGKSYI